MKGSYILLIHLNQDRSLQVGKKHILLFKKGYYVYVGSALNGIEQRIHRHLRSKKRIHWHIDYLLKYGKIKHVFYKESRRKEECEIAAFFARKLASIKGFGCSDCRCKSHLFYGSQKTISSIIQELGMKQFQNKNT